MGTFNAIRALICLAAVIFFVALSIYGYILVRKAKAKVRKHLDEARLLEEEGDDRGALLEYKDALAVVFGIHGNEEWTAKGLCEQMEEIGWEVIDEMERLYRKFGIPFHVGELERLMETFDRFSKDKKMVDEYGLPKKGRGKEIHADLQDRLTDFHDDLPEI